MTETVDLKFHQVLTPHYKRRSRADTTPPVYIRFTEGFDTADLKAAEGFDTADLKAAKALIDALTEAARRTFRPGSSPG